MGPVEPYAAVVRSEVPPRPVPDRLRQAAGVRSPQATLAMVLASSRPVIRSWQRVTMAGVQVHS